MPAFPAERLARLQAERKIARRVSGSKHSKLLAARRRELSPRQRALHDDRGAQICVISTRQSGKTSEAILKIAEMMFGTPGSITYFIMPTRDRARDTFWDRWKEATKEFGLSDANHHETLLETRTPDGSILRLIGVPDKKRADRIRGQTLNLIVIDEAANFADDVLKYLVEDCCSAALGIRGGQLYLCSTPGPQPEGYLYRAYTDPKMEFSRHFLELRDNPAWKDPDDYLAKVLRRFGYSKDDPIYQREWLGKWVADLSARVYRIEDHNLIDAPSAYTYTVMAVDLGATDESAFSVLGWRAGSKKLQVLVDEAEDDLDLTSVAERIKQLQADYRPLVTMVDGAAKQSVLEIQNRHGIPLEATPKAPGYKPKAIAQMNADFRRGLLEVPRHFEVVGQMRALQWAQKARGVRENQGQPNDRCDALLYAYLRASAYTEHEPEELPAEGSKSFYDAQQAAIREAHVRASQPKDMLDPWGNSGRDPW